MIKREGKRSRWRLVAYLVTGAAALAVICMIGCVLFPDWLVNSVIKPRIATALMAAFPNCSIRLGDIHCRVLSNRIAFDSVSVLTNDSTWTCESGAFSLTGFSWKHLLIGRSPVPADFGQTSFDIQDIRVVIAETHLELLCERLHMSAADSVVSIGFLAIHPECSDEKYFAASPNRRPRVMCSIPEVRIAGAEFVGLLQGNGLRARSIAVHDARFDVLINKDKASKSGIAEPPMPNQMLESIRRRFQIDSLILVAGRLEYGERFAVGARPGKITFDSVGVIVEGFTNHAEPGAVVAIAAQGIFLKAGLMTLKLTVPIGIPELTYHYSGSLSRMDIRGLNEFLEPAEHIRMKGGLLDTASYDIDVVSGCATGSVRAVYKGLSLTAIDKKTGSQKGIFNRITSFISSFKLRGTNEPHKSGWVKMGKVKYCHKEGEYFLEFSWFALRGGLGDVIGF